MTKRVEHLRQIMAETERNLASSDPNIQRAELLETQAITAHELGGRAIFTGLALETPPVGGLLDAPMAPTQTVDISTDHPRLDSFEQ